MLLAYNKTASPVVLAAGSPARTLPAGAPPARGPAVDVTSELEGLAPADYTALQAQVASGDVEYEWTHRPEYPVGSLIVIDLFESVGAEAKSGMQAVTADIQAKLTRVSTDANAALVSAIDNLTNHLVSGLNQAEISAATYADVVAELLGERMARMESDVAVSLSSEVATLNDRINKVHPVVLTGDAAVTDLATITIPLYKPVLLEVRIIAERTDGRERALYTIEAFCRVVPSLGTLTVSGVPTDGDQIEIDSYVYTAKTALTPVAGEVLIGGSAANFIANLIAAITNTGTPGTDYADGTPLHPSVTARGDSPSTMQAVAKVPGVAGDAITTTDPVDTGTVLNWGGATLAGGSDMTVSKVLERDDVEDDASWDKNLVAGTGHTVKIQGQGAAGKNVNWIPISRMTLQS